MATIAARLISTTVLGRASSRAGGREQLTAISGTITKKRRSSATLIAFILDPR